MGKLRGRLVHCDVRKEAILLVKEAVSLGARKHKVCQLLSVSVRTIERWEKENGLIDKRKNAKRIYLF